MIRFLRRMRNPGAACGKLVAVEFREDGVAVAASAGKPPGTRLVYCDFIPRLESGLGQIGLGELVAKAGLQGTPTSLVLSPGQYRMDLIEAPDVPPEDLREAVRWKVASLLEYPIEEAAVDAFLMPKDGLRGGPQTAFVVTAQRSVVKQLLDQLQDAELDPVHVDVRELALRNVIERYCENPRAGALLSLREHGGDLTIVRDGNLYISRSVNFSVQALQGDPVQREAALEELVVEVQRSLDYFEIQLRQAAVSRLAVVPLLQGMDIVMEKLSSTIGAEVFPLESDELAMSEKALSSVKKLYCVSAIGGSMRSEEPPGAAAG